MCTANRSLALADDSAGLANRTPGQRASPPDPVQRHLRPRVDPSAALGVRPCSVEDRWPVEDPPTKVSSEVSVWFPTSEMMMMLFAAEIGAVAGLMMGPYLGEPNRS
jgi:hypothetical protein